VIWTDLVQFIIYVGGALVAAAFILHYLPGGFDEFVAVNQSEGKFQIIDLDPSLTVSYTLWAGLIAGAFVTMASHGADQSMVQRYLCARSLTQARTALVLSGFFVMTQFALFLMIGLGLFALYKAGELDVTGDTPPDAIFGKFIVTKLPSGIIGLLTAAVLSSAMGSFSSSLNSAANAFVADFYRPLRPHHDEGFYLRLSKMMTSILGIAKISVALLCVPLLTHRSVVDQVLSVAAVTTGLILGLFILGSLRRPVRSEAALVGMVTGFAITGTFWVFWVAGSPITAWPWFAVIGTLTTVFAALLTNPFLTKQAPEAVEKHGSPADGSTQPGIGESR
jgi:SSS family solute:Na+ symporter